MVHLWLQLVPFHEAGCILCHLCSVPLLEILDCCVLIFQHGILVLSMVWIFRGIHSPRNLVYVIN
jgi:hypothetical protein